MPPAATRNARAPNTSDQAWRGPRVPRPHLSGCLRFPLCRLSVFVRGWPAGQPWRLAIDLFVGKDGLHAVIAIAIALVVYLSPSLWYASHPVYSTLASTHFWV